jgi:small-conductance mechanosensitive channel
MKAAFLLCWLLLVPGAALWGQEGGDGNEPERVVTAPVVVDGRTLCSVRGVSSLPAPRRAALIASRIRTVARDSGFRPDALELVEVGTRIEIRARELVVMGVTDGDAQVDGVGRSDLATAHRNRFVQAIESYRAERTAAALRTSAVWAAAGLVVLAIGLVVVLWLFRGARRLLEQRLRRRIQTVGIQSFEILRAESIWKAVGAVLQTLRALALVALLLIFADFTLGLFPWTRAAAVALRELVAGPLASLLRGLAHEIPSLIFLVILFLLLRFMLRLTKLFFDAVGARAVVIGEFDPEWAAPTYRLVRFALVAFAVIVAYPYIPGSDSAAFQGVSLFVGIVFSLGSSSFVSNLIAGYAMTYRRALQPGDRVKIGSVVGDVTHKRLQATHVRTLKNEEVVIPNATILSGEVTNYSSLARTDGLILHTTVGIGYEVPWRQVEAMLLLAAGRTNGLLPEPRPFVLQKGLGDFAVSYEINAYTREPLAMTRIYSDLHRNILDVFNEYGVQIMTPAYEGDPPEPKLVPRERWNAAPAEPDASPPAGSRT